MGKLSDILKKILSIDEDCFVLNNIDPPPMIKNRLHKNSKKENFYVLGKIEENLITEKQADEAIEKDENKYFLELEQDISYLIFTIPIFIVFIEK